MPNSEPARVDFMSPDQLLAELTEMKARLEARNAELAAGTIDPYDLYIYYPYELYLNTPLWRKIKRRVFKRDNKTCRRCGGVATVVHHRSYTPEVMRGEDDEQLDSCCDACHQIIHRRPDGSARPPEECESILLAGPGATPAATGSNP